MDNDAINMPTCHTITSRVAAAESGIKSGRALQRFFAYPICDTAFLFGQKISGREAAEEMENTKMKKIMAIVLAALSIAAFAACGKKDDAPKPGTLKEGETVQSVLEAVDAKFSDRYGSDYSAVAMGMPVDDAYLSDFLELDSSAYDEYAGNVSMSMTNSLSSRRRKVRLRRFSRLWKSAFPTSRRNMSSTRSAAPTTARWREKFMSKATMFS